MLSVWGVLAIAVAGGVGAATRHAIDSSVPDRLRARFPIGITAINLSGSLLLGMVLGSTLPAEISTVLAMGFFGGFTTWSTASLDTVQLLRQRRWRAALLNGPGIAVLALLCAWCGIAIVS